MKDKKKTLPEESVSPDTREEVQYGEKREQQIIHHEKRQSSRPHECKGPQCEEVYEKPKY